MDIGVLNVAKNLDSATSIRYDVGRSLMKTQKSHFFPSPGPKKA